jgi:hypothetical protein
MRKPSNLSMFDFLPMLKYLSAMNKIAQAGQVVYIRDEYYADNNLSVMEIPRYSWRVLKVDNSIAACEFQRKGKNSVLTLTIELKYLKVEMI